jgi:hypothetical protein
VAGVEATFEGGPVDGRIMAVETAGPSLLPAVVVLPQTGVHFGSGDQPEPTREHRYVRVPDTGRPVLYRYLPS